MVVKCADFKPDEYFKNVPLLKNRKGNPGGKRRKYIGITTAFDIETSLLPDIRQSFMYIWQWQFSTDYTVIGRTWEEFIDLRARIKAALPDGRWLVIFVHNLSFEFQFLKDTYPFDVSEVFAIDSRKILKCDMMECFEFRCSYRLTNMSLSEFTKKMKVKHQKLSGEEFDYTEQRFPWTKLSKKQIEYCVNDVLGLVEAINALLARDGDTLQTMPMTSTGYVRRNAKRAMKNGIHHNFIYSILPDYEIYCALREAFRGGNTHANRYFAGDIVQNVHSADRSSSYPAVICNCEFPMTEFIPIAPSDLNMDYMIRCMTIRHKALLLRIGIKNLQLRNKFWGCPYLSTDKCRNIHNAIDTEDNGRILEAEYLETTVTDIDLKIIMDEYEGEIIFLQAWYSSYKKLPQPLINEVIKYYKDKTELKGVKGQEMQYDKSKALLNSLYGMMAQSSVKAKQLYRHSGEFANEYSLITDNEQYTDTEKEQLIRMLEIRLLGEYNRKAFLAYQWGVWVTSHARFCLEEGIKLAHQEGCNFIYCDTDSVKYIGDIDWSDYNNARIVECRESGAYAVDPAGVTHYMGVFENEDNPETGYAYAEFKTLGAKKYAYKTTTNGETHCTIAGVNKAKGGKELDKHGGLQAFQEGFVFTEAGGTEAVYNDDPEIKELTIDGHQLQLTSNVAIMPSMYKLGITGDYERIIKYAKNYLANPYVI